MAPPSPPSLGHQPFTSPPAKLQHTWARRNCRKQSIVINLYDRRCALRQRISSSHSPAFSRTLEWKRQLVEPLVLCRYWLCWWDAVHHSGVHQYLLTDVIMGPPRMQHSSLPAFVKQRLSELMWFLKSSVSTWCTLKECTALTLVGTQISAIFDP